MWIERMKVEERIPSEALVLDVCGWNKIFPRADWAIDMNPFKSRHHGSEEDREAERVSEQQWVVGDVNLPEAWSQFSDKSFDFVICSHLLEDVRDPCFVMRQLLRVGRAGYIETPYRFLEVTRNDPRCSVSGWGHHRWIVECIDDEVVFTPKLHWANTIDYLGEGRRSRGWRPRFSFLGIFWEDSIGYYERFPKWEVLQGASILWELDQSEVNPPQTVFNIVNPARREEHITGCCLWVDKYKLPIELCDADTQKRYMDKYIAMLAETGRTPS